MVSDGDFETSVELQLDLVCCLVVAVSLGVCVCSWPGGMRHPASTLGARAGAVSCGVSARELFDDLLDCFDVFDVELLDLFLVLM